MAIIQPRRFHPGKALLVAAVIVVFYLYTYTRPAPPFEWDYTGGTMGTSFTVKFLGPPDLSTNRLQEIRSGIDIVLEEVNRQMSTWMNDSEISVFNRLGAGVEFPVSPAFAEVAGRAVELNRDTGGAFDPTLDPLIRLWGFEGGKPARTPGEQEISAALASTGVRHLTVGRDSLKKSIPGLQLNLSAIAKGFGVDAVGRFHDTQGVTNFFVEIGGEVTARGVNRAGRSWRIGIELPDPDAVRGESFAAILNVSGVGVATSGDYRNFFTGDDGVRYSHIFDPRTGRPVRSSLGSVTVIARDCMTADGLATALFVMGSDEGTVWAETQNGIEACFVVHTADGGYTNLFTSGFEAYIHERM